MTAVRKRTLEAIDQSMKISVFFLLVFHTLFYGAAFGQKATEVIYKRYSNGKPVPGHEIKLIFKDNVAWIQGGAGQQGSEFIDYHRKMAVDMITHHGTGYKAVIPFDSLPQPRLTNDTDTILDFPCKKMVFSYFSNTIAVWYTDAAGAKGSPYKRYIPDDGLALRIVINGSRELKAEKINRLPGDYEIPYHFDLMQSVSQARFRELQIRSRYVSLKVFDRQQINFDPKIPAPSLNAPDSVYRCSKGSVIIKKIKLPAIVKEGASVFAALTEWSVGDAYDRSGSVFTITTGKGISMLDALKKGIKQLPVTEDNNGRKYQGIIMTEKYGPALELMRFFTPFGVSHFNKLREIHGYRWADSAYYKSEITALVPNDADEMWIGVFIGNYDKSGHRVSLELDFYPAWEKGDFPVRWRQPLFNTVNIMEMSGQNYGRLFGNDTLRVAFSVPEDIDSLQLVYTTTGHGGWGAGDEFVPRKNRILIDGREAFSVVPWRTDCGTYRLSNPASGNFGNGLSSSDLSRSNWCPGAVAPPYFIPLCDLAPGKHVIEVIIDQGKDEGSSFSHWQVSGTLTGVRK